MVDLTDAALPLRRVAIFSSGVGHFEHRGEVTEPARVSLPFAAREVSDVLKSLTIDDPSGDQVAVAYATEDALWATLQGLRPDVSGNPGLADLLNSVRGATLEVDVPSGRRTGRILGVEVRPGSGDTPPEPCLSLYADGAVSLVPASQIRAYRLVDAQMAADVKRALDHLLESNRPSRRLEVRLSSDQARTVGLGYVTPTPVWKATYRLDVTAGPPLLQGWAIVDNASDVDWDDIELSLFVGRPASFTQPLYEAQYVQREVVPLEIAGSADVHRYDAAAAGGMADVSEPAMLTASRREMRGALPPMALAAPAPVPVQAAGRPAGEQFSFTFPGQVTIGGHESAMLPFVQGGIDGEKVSILVGDEMADGAATNPALGLRVTNNLGVALPPGPITVFDDGLYAGDALIGFLPTGAQRLISYGDDLGVQASRDTASSQRVASVRLANGLLELTWATLVTAKYRLVNEAAKDRRVWVQHPRWGDAQLVKPKEPAELTAGAYRFDVDLAAQSSLVFEVVTRQSVVSSVSLTDDPDAVLRFATDGELPPRTAQLMRDAAAIRQRQLRAEADLASVNARSAALAADQARVRETLAVVGIGTRSGATYQKRLDELEDRLVALSQQQDDLQKQADEAAAELARFLASQDFGEDA